MELISVYSPSHEILKDEWFLRTLKDDYEVRLHRCEVKGKGKFMDEDWMRAVLFKSAKIIEAIRENWGKVFVYSDVDVAFFASTREAILSRLEGHDIVCQLDDPQGNLCTGFFGIRANETTLMLWQEVYKAIERERRDQIAFNRLVREMKGLRAGYLPAPFFGMGTFSARAFEGRETFFVPADPVMFHANWTVGIDNKLALLAQAQRVIDQGAWGRAANNFFFEIEHGKRGRRTAESLTNQDGITSFHDV